MIVAQKQEITGAAAGLVKNYLRAANQYGGSDAKERKKGETLHRGSPLITLRDQLKQLRSEV